MSHKIALVVADAPANRDFLERLIDGQRLRRVES